MSQEKVSENKVKKSFSKNQKLSAKTVVSWHVLIENYFEIEKRCMLSLKILDKSHILI